jgi:hypothetical protein
MPKVLYAITAHGFGHATRSVLVAKVLQQQFPHIELCLSTAVDGDAMQRFITDMQLQCSLRRQDYEPGMVQHTCFELDNRATCEKYRSLSREMDQRIDSETRFLREQGFDAVISDVAAIPLAAANRLDLPSAVIGNFTWDWIVQPLFGDDSELQAYCQRMQAQYHTASMYFRLPMHAQQHPFKYVGEAPLVGRRSRLDRADIFAHLGMVDDPARPLVLVAIGGWDARGLQPIVIENCSDYRFLVVGEIDISAPGAQLLRVPFSIGEGVGFPDLVSIADCGVVKPGYGTCAEFVLNAAAMVGIVRNDNREAQVLREGVSRYIPFSELSLDDFFAGHWREALDQIRALPVPVFADQSSELTRFAAQVGEVLSL